MARTLPIFPFHGFGRRTGGGLPTHLNRTPRHVRGALVSPAPGLLLGGTATRLLPLRAHARGNAEPPRAWGHERIALNRRSRPGGNA